MNRRDFIGTCGLGCLGASCTFLAPRLGRAEEALHPARHWERLEGGRVRCLLCPRRCLLAPRERGTCGVRKNEGGALYTLVHSRPCTLRSDPIEKKPLFHFLPGSDAFSLATAGCNFECRFCQNWRISQFRPAEVESIHLAPPQVVEQARSAGARSVAYTYSEPVVFFEYMADISRAAHEVHLANVMISNGFINAQPMGELLGLLDAVKIDLKAFQNGFYQRVCDGELRPVLETLRLVRQRNVWLEIVVLVIPTLNDGEAETRAMCRWILQELGPDVPLHFSRFHPTYRLTNLPPTPVPTIERLRRIALDVGLRHVYLGNVPGHEGEHTYCHQCRQLVIRREGFLIRENRLQQGRCPRCRTAVAGVWTLPARQP